jgi:Tol biopolymer transport system component
MKTSTMKRSPVLWAAIGMLFLASAAIDAPANAVVPGTNGRILYTRAIFHSTISWQLEAADPDGTDMTVLATFPRDAFDEEMFANWSPDAKTVILNIYNALWVVDADGSDLHELISCSSPGVYCGPDGGFGPGTFTPEGNHIVVGHCCTNGDGLYMLNADGSGLKAIKTNRGGGFGNPQVSPDGRTIAFRICADASPGCAVGTMNINGGNLRMLTDGSVNWDFPNWSPDSKRIAISGFNGGSANIAVMNADGSSFRQLTSDPSTYSVWACFSPDGTEILFSRAPSTSWWDLYTMHPDGTGVTQVTHTADAELWPQWAAA